MKAVILAAGLGNRLRAVNPDKPKPLFEIDGKSLLEYSLEALNIAGMNQVDIVVGYKSEMVKSKLGQRFKQLELNYPENPDYDKTGSMHSLFCAMENPEDTLVLDGDLVYSPKIITRMLESPKKDLAFLTRCKGDGNETYVVLDEKDKIVYLALNKALPDEMRQNTVCEFNGVAKLSRNFLESLLVLYTHHKNNGRLKDYYEELAFEISKFIPWYGMHDSNLLLAEVDKPEDIPKARAVIEKVKIK